MDINQYMEGVIFNHVVIPVENQDMGKTQDT